MGACAFCDVLAGEREAAFVRRGAGWAVFLDARPVFPGHCLVVPERHAATLLDLEVDEVAALFVLARSVGGAVERGLGAEGFFLAVNHKVSQSVPHLHVHVVPRRRGDGLRGFFWPRRGYRDAQEREDFRRRLALALDEAR